MQKKQAMVTPSSGPMPMSPYKAPPMKLGSSEDSCCTWLMTAIPRRITASPDPRSSCGSAACTVGVSNALSTDRETISAPTAMMLNPPSCTANHEAAARTSSPEPASSATMMVRRLTRSASTPPNGESRMVGTIAAASTEAKTVADPVSSSTHIDMANRSIMLPNRDSPCPMTSRM